MYDDIGFIVEGLWGIFNELLQASSLRWGVQP